MRSSDIFLYVYVIGMFIAFIIGCIDAYKRHKRKENIDDFPAMISAIALSSWVYIGICVYQKLKSCLKRYLKH